MILIEVAKVSLKAVFTDISTGLYMRILVTSAITNKFQYDTIMQFCNIILLTWECALAGFKYNSIKIKWFLLWNEQNH